QELGDDNTPLGMLPSSPTAMDVDSSAPVRSSVNSETAGRSSMGNEIVGCSSVSSETAGRSSMNSETAATKSRNDAAAAATFLGTPVKRFVNGYIVLDEFGKEMAALAMALHTLELDRQMDRIASTSHADVLEDEYADLLEYYDPDEPAYKQAMSIRTSLQPTSRPPIIDLGSQQVYQAPEATSPTKSSQPKRAPPAPKKDSRQRSSRPSAGT
ncbi:hypothetical protein IW137_002195, partial [Coemansia sp. RSA 1287]